MKKDNFIEKFVIFLFLLVIIWFIASWINILMHNNPVDGDFNYAFWNLFVLFIKIPH